MFTVDELEALVEIGADLRGIDLSGDDYTGANIPKANLQGSTLIGTIFTGANLAGADLSNTVVTSANFDGANLDGVLLTRATCNLTSFISASMEELSAVGVNFVFAILTSAILYRADLRFSDARFTSFVLADMRGVLLDGADVRSTNFGLTIFDGHVSLDGLGWRTP